MARTPARGSGQPAVEAAYERALLAWGSRSMTPFGRGASAPSAAPLLRVAAGRRSAA